MPPSFRMACKCSKIYHLLHAPDHACFSSPWELQTAAAISSVPQKHALYSFRLPLSRVSVMFRTLVKGQIIHAGMVGIWVADGMSWRQLEGELLQTSSLLDVSPCTETESDVTAVFEEQAAWRRFSWARFFCALDVAVGPAGSSAAPP